MLEIDIRKEGEGICSWLRRDRPSKVPLASTLTNLVPVQTLDAS